MIFHVTFLRVQCVAISGFMGKVNVFPLEWRECPQMSLNFSVRSNGWSSALHSPAGQITHWLTGWLSCWCWCFCSILLLRPARTNRSNPLSVWRRSKTDSRTGVFSIYRPHFYSNIPQPGQDDNSAPCWADWIMPWTRLRGIDAVDCFG